MKIPRNNWPCFEMREVPSQYLIICEVTIILQSPNRYSFVPGWIFNQFLLWEGVWFSTQHLIVGGILCLLLRLYKAFDPHDPNPSKCSESLLFCHLTFVPESYSSNSLLNSKPTICHTAWSLTHSLSTSGTCLLKHNMRTSDSIAAIRQHVADAASRRQAPLCLDEEPGNEAK